MIRYMWAIVRRDLLLVARQPAEMINPLVFFLLVIALFPLGVSPEAALLSQTAAGVIWVAAMLATLLSLELLFKLDHDDGSLEQLLLAPYPSWSLVLAKVFVHWLVSGLPLILISPLIATMLFLPSHAVPTLMLSLLIGTPTLSLLGAIGAALVTGVRGGGMLLTLLILPLYVPVIIFGASSVAAAAQGMAIGGYMALLAAMFVFALMITPWSAGSALKL
ncbi:heme exporter protein CcmB [Candidatus Njordibacter sp. Uisw_056]|jgi:heme exporter protein B|uniref:heme exporter protein CcmB n=1 Tax=Candidatus Njordibacter sp. Uisw_056 TaxID=3230973 RepID=UPI003D3EBE5B|tara:strand:- start:9918 stop:10577 length:660 start_codon:yes stop_codon:yes gene_type:complete